MAFSKTFPKQIWKVKADISQPIVADRWARRKFRYVKRKFEFDYVGLGAHRAVLTNQNWWLVAISGQSEQIWIESRYLKIFSYEVKYPI